MSAARVRPLIILAAGRGTRLGAAAEGRPKAMTPLHGRPLIDWQLAAARRAGIDRAVIVRGYRADALKIDAPAGMDVQFIDNAVFDRTNMAYSLWTAREHMTGGAIVAYGDIAYSPRTMEAVLAGDAEIAVAVDLDWEGYWRRRFADPLDDAETLRMDGVGRITDIGRKPRTLGEIMGQYIGLTAYGQAGAVALLSILDNERLAHVAGGRRLHEERSFPDLYMTDVIQGLASAGRVVRAATIRGGWLEIDTPRDLELAHELSRASAAGGARRRPAGDSQEGREAERRSNRDLEITR